MNNAELYKSKNGLQQNDSVYVIENFLNRLKWKSAKNNILDIGSGDGYTLCKILLPKISEKVDKIFGIDISSDMINFSRKEYGNENIIFEQLDIATLDIPVEFYEKFNQIFSFFCLHWVPKQSLAFKNIYEMLKPDGYILLTFWQKIPYTKSTTKWLKQINGDHT
ncbi:hypothetical protein HHI36_009864 [Cryptolaemus montrouzieri]|uniref:Juvenile hormone acid methyltransferase n=1 Tax=Cryptolaemus montrouzieri TaxID=559131 RepID=A0ABD2MH51_9CUCU